jgi:hypothetical protein
MTKGNELTDVVSRRRMLRLAGAAGIAGLAGCTEGSDDSDDSSAETNENSGTQTGGSSSSDQILLETAGGSPGGTGYAIMNAVSKINI